MFVPQNCAVAGWFLCVVDDLWLLFVVVCDPVWVGAGYAQPVLTL
jgi:hypothetical protein